MLLQQRVKFVRAHTARAIANPSMHHKGSDPVLAAQIRRSFHRGELQCLLHGRRARPMRRTHEVISGGMSLLLIQMNPCANEIRSWFLPFHSKTEAAGADATDPSPQLTASFKSTGFGISPAAISSSLSAFQRAGSDFPKDSPQSVRR